MTARFMSGFGSHFASEAVPGALPHGRNSPQRPAFGLYAEQLSGTAFTAPRRREPALLALPDAAQRRAPALQALRRRAPVRARHDRRPARRPTGCAGIRSLMPDDGTDFIDGLVTMMANRDPADLEGVAVHVYRANADMADRYFFDADGELLLIPEQGRLDLRTEMGRIEIAPGEVALIPRGVRFQVLLPDGQARGYVAENHGALFRLPELGPIGANGLANPRDFLTPEAAYEDREGALRARPEASRVALGDDGSATARSTSSPGTATWRPGSTTSRCSTRSARSASTIPIPRSSPS